MTYEELQNKAYLIATGNSLCETLSYQETQDISDEDIMNIVWEPFENWTADDLHSHIAQIASNIIDAFKDEI